jgi:hypothetical protein
MDNPGNGKGAPTKGAPPNNGHQHDDLTKSLQKQRGKIKPKRRRPQTKESDESKKDRGDPGRIAGVRRKNVERVVRHRYGALTLPDDYDGRAIAQLLLELGTDGITIQHIAPWATGEALDDLIRRADGNYARWGKEEVDGKTITERIGERLDVTFNEFKICKLTHVWPCDVDRHVVQDYIRERRTANELNRKRRKRAPAKQSKPAVTDPWDLPDDSRTKALALTALSDRQLWSVRALAEYARDNHLGAFEGLDHKATSQATLRAVKELATLGIVETRKQIGARALSVLYVRRPMDSFDETEVEDIINTDDDGDGLESDRGRPPRGAAADRPA